VSCGQVADPRITVIASDDATPYREALAGFQQYLRRQGVQANFDVHFPKGDASGIVQTLEDAKAKGSSLILTMGTLASQMACSSNDMDIPIITGLVLDLDSLEKECNATGVTLEFPLEIQFQWLQRFLPDVRSVGLIYNLNENRKKVEIAGQLAQKMGFKLNAQQVDTPQDLPLALKRIAEDADVLLGLADEIVLAPETAKHILLSCFRNRIPFVGLSPAWVKAGALYCLAWDYTDIGIQCGEIAVKVLKGVKASTILPVSPRKVSYSVNLKTERHMKLQISESLIENARQVYE